MSAEEKVKSMHDEMIKMKNQIKINAADNSKTIAYTTFVPNLAEIKSNPNTSSKNKIEVIVPAEDDDNFAVPCIFLDENHFTIEGAEYNLSVLYSKLKWNETNDILIDSNITNHGSSHDINVQLVTRINNIQKTYNSVTFLPNITNKKLHKVNGLFVTAIGGRREVQTGPGISLNPYSQDITHFFEYRRIHRDEIQRVTPSVTHGEATKLSRIAYEGVLPFYISNSTKNYNISDITQGLFTQDKEQQYSVEWFGYFNPQIAGKYEFSITSDDASYLWLGDAAVSMYTTTSDKIGSPTCNDKGQHGMARAYNNKPRFCNTNEYVPIRIMFGQARGGADLRINIKLNGNDVLNTDGLFCYLYNDDYTPYEPIQLYYAFSDNGNNTDTYMLAVAKYDENNNYFYNNLMREARSHDNVIYTDTNLTPKSVSQTPKEVEGHKLGFDINTGELNITYKLVANNLEQKTEIFTFQPQKFGKYNTTLAKETAEFIKKQNVPNNYWWKLLLYANSNGAGVYDDQTGKIMYNLAEDFEIDLPNNSDACFKWNWQAWDMAAQFFTQGNPNNIANPWACLLGRGEELITEKARKSHYYYKGNNAKTCIIAWNGNYKMTVTQEGLVLRKAHIPTAVINNDITTKTIITSGKSEMSQVFYHFTSDLKIGKTFLVNNVNKSLTHLSHDGADPVLKWSTMDYSSINNTGVPSMTSDQSITDEHIKNQQTDSDEHCIDKCNETNGCTWASYNNENKTCYYNNNFSIPYRITEVNSTLHIRQLESPDSTCLFKMGSDTPITNDLTKYSIHSSSTPGIQTISKILTYIPHRDEKGEKIIDGLHGFDINANDDIAIISYINKHPKFVIKTDGKWSPHAQLMEEANLNSHGPPRNYISPITGTDSFDTIVFTRQMSLYETSFNKNNTPPCHAPKKISTPSEIHVGYSYITKDGKYIFLCDPDGSHGMYYSKKNNNKWSEFKHITSSHPRNTFMTYVSRETNGKYRILCTFDNGGNAGARDRNNIWWADWSETEPNPPFKQINIEDNVFKYTPFLARGITMSSDLSTIICSCDTGIINCEISISLNADKSNYTIYKPIPESSIKKDVMPCMVKLSADGTKLYKAGYPENDIDVCDIALSAPLSPNTLTACQQNVDGPSKILGLNSHDKNPHKTKNPDKENFTSDRISSMFSSYLEPFSFIKEGFQASTHTYALIGTTVADESKVTAPTSDLSNSGTTVGGRSVGQAYMDAYEADIYNPSVRNANTYIEKRADAYNQYFTENREMAKLVQKWNNSPNYDAIDHSGNLYYNYDENNPSPRLQDAMLSDTKQGLVQYNSMYILGTVAATACLVAGIALGSSK